MDTPADWPPVAVTMPERHEYAPAPGTVLPEHYAGCFGCGHEAAGGLRMRFVAGEGMRVHASFVVRREHQGAPGIAHGGILTAALDEVLGTINVLTMKLAVTGKLDTEFRKPVPVGATLHLTSTLDGFAGRRIYVHGEGRLHEPDGPVAVTATAVFITVPQEHFTEHGRLPRDAAPEANPLRR